MLIKKKGIIFLVSVLIISLFSMIPLNYYSKKEVKTWMSYIHDDTKIKDISIPGTHNTSTHHAIFDFSGKCQDLNVKNQLKIGVRFLDIRLKLVNNKLRIVHDFIDQKLSFNSVLKDIDSFIKEYDSEFIIMSVKEDSDSKNSSLTFDEALFNELNKYQDVISFDKSLPTYINEARGKIYIANRHNSDYGIDLSSGWKDNETFIINDYYIQDNYCVDSNEEKIDYIKNTIDYINNNDSYVINFTSCYIDGKLPTNNAGVPSRVINDWFISYINESNMKLGIVVMDYMTKELAEAIYMRNYL